MLKRCCHGLVAAVLSLEVEATRRAEESVEIRVEAQ
jgi:hypothetical protein